MTFQKKYNLDQIDKWVRDGEVISPHVAKELLYTIQEQERKIAICANFVEWLTPCGQTDQKSPCLDVIGIEARDLIKKLSKP